MQENRLWSRSELARKLNVSPDTVDNWRKQGRLRAVRLPGGEHRMILPRQLLEQIESARDELRDD